MKVSLIVATAENGVIGKQGTLLPWRLSADLIHFKSLTMGHPIIMGRKTYETFRKALPGRQNIIVTHDQNYVAPGCTIVDSLQAALDVAEPKHEVFIIGGATIYEQALPLANKLYMTQVHAHVDGDVFFHYDAREWQQVTNEPHEADEKNEYPYSFTTFVRKN